MKFSLSQVLALLFLFCSSTVVHAANDQQSQELAELQNLSLDTPVFIEKGVQLGAVNLSRDEDAWMSDELSTSQAAPVRNSDEGSVQKIKDEQTLTPTITFPLAPEQSTAPRRRSR
ncbi:MAG: hypothetical protein Fur0010_26620 [Bdellovibrio sp.]